MQKHILQYVSQINLILILKLNFKIKTTKLLIILTTTFISLVTAYNSLNIGSLNITECCLKQNGMQLQPRIVKQPISEAVIACKTLTDRTLVLLCILLCLVSLYSIVMKLCHNNPQFFTLIENYFFTLVYLFKQPHYTNQSPPLLTPHSILF